ncbi:fatty acid hydroxylase family protein [Roseicella aquatilis]|uniref:Fatty acid hydroxylase family protein n=2 Tax=Roseicella aquatilis TaxID=2527868 RepID=A0A4R4DWB1_9PROT|nr:fatty acid hydroxylase family protein [Roseicella aquatilis]
MDYAEDAYAWLDFALFGLLGIAVVVLVCRPLEAWRPVEPVTDRRAIRTDMLYTVLSRLGLLPLLAFVLLSSAQAAWEGWLTEAGLLPPTLEELVPALRDHPLLAFACYVVILDFAEYWRHRAQHGFRWWWALHAIHHAQRQMTFWTDDRNHVLDDVIAAVWFGAIALLIGVPPGQFPLIALVLRFAESLSHANVRLDYGRVGERLLVSPRFHRMHHAPVSAGQHGKNFAVLLPVWDWVFGTADWKRGEFLPTGTPEEPEVLATGGWWRQQLVGLRRMAGALAGR